MTQTLTIEPKSFALDPQSMWVSPKIAAVIGIDAAVMLNQVWYCFLNPHMKGMEVDGRKWIRNPIKCTDVEKIERAEEHGKQIDWLSNFTWSSAYKISANFKKLEKLGLIKTAQFRSKKWDQCKYYTVVVENLEKFLKPLQLSIFDFFSNRSEENFVVDSRTVKNHIKVPLSREDFQDQEHTPNPSEVDSTVCVSGIVENTKEGENQEEKPLVKSHRSKPRQERGSARRTEDPLLDQSSAVRVEATAVNYDGFNEKLLEYGQKCPTIYNPTGFANAVIQAIKSGSAEPNYQLLWKEYQDGIPLGSTGVIPSGHILRGVPAPIVAEAIFRDCQAKPGTTLTEAAANAAKNLQKPAIVAAVGDAVKVQVSRTLDDARRKIELGISPENALSSSLPAYSQAYVDLDGYAKQLAAPSSLSEMIESCPEESPPEPSVPEAVLPAVTQETTVVNQSTRNQIDDDSPLTLQQYLYKIQLRFGTGNPSPSAIGELRDLIDSSTFAEIEIIKQSFLGSPIAKVRTWAERKIEAMIGEIF